MKILFLMLFTLTLGIHLIPNKVTANNFQNNIIDKEEIIDFEGIKAVPFENRYTTDYLSEPLYTTINSLNFNALNIGDTWKNYRGEQEDGTPVTVAVIDSGIDIYHEDFLNIDKKNVTINESNVTEYSILDPKSCYIHDTTGVGRYTSSVKTEVGILKAHDTDIYDSDIDEYYSHGTASAACIGAMINGVGGFGVAPKVNLLIIRIDFFFNSLDVAIRYAADNGAKVINMSLGAYGESFVDGFGNTQVGSSSVSSALTSAINYALNKDVVVVAAAGNEKTSKKSYPACNAGVIGVGALDRKSSLTAANFSNFNSSSDTSSSNNNVDVMAPGYVYTAQVPTNGYPTSGNLIGTNYEETQGTSFASPLTAGVIALGRAKFKELSHTEIEQRLFDSCYDIGSKGWDTSFGFGRVDVTKFLQDYTLKSISASPSTVYLDIGDTEKIEISYEPSNATNKLVNFMSYDEDIATVDIDTGLITAVSYGETTIECIPDESGVEEAVVNVIVTDNLSIPSEDDDYNYQKVTSQADITSGDYLIVYEKESLAFNGALGGSIDANLNNISVTIDSNTISKSETIDAAAFTYNSNEKTLCTSNGYYIGSTQSGSNVINISTTTKYKNELVYNDGNVNIKAMGTSDTTNGSELRFNDAANVKRFRFMKSSSVSSYKALQLYKKTKLGKRTLDYIQATYEGNPLYIGDTLDSSKFVVKAKFKEESDLINVSDYSVSGFNSSVAGTNTVIISYSYQGVDKTTTVDLTINSIILNSITATCSSIYHPGETLNKNNITVTGHYNNGDKPITDFTLDVSDNYMFTYEDSGTKIIQVSKGDVHTDLSINVTRVSYSPVSGSNTTFTAAAFKTAGVSTNSSKKSTGTFKVNNINWSVDNMYIYTSGNTSYMSFGNTATGYVSNVDAFSSPISKVEYTLRSGSPAPLIYLSKDGSSWVNYSTQTASNDAYNFVKLTYVGATVSTYSNITNFKITFTGADNPTNVSNFIMYQDTANQCNSKFYTARTYYLSMTDANKNIFQTSDDYVISTARNRYLAWARYLGEDPYSKNKLGTSAIFFNGDLSSSPSLIAVFITVISTIGISVTFYKRKKKA